MHGHDIPILSVFSIGVENINVFRHQAPGWHRLVFRNISAKKKRIRARLAGIQRALGFGLSPFLDNLQTELLSLYDHLSDMEKSIWAQRARVCNFVYKDLNTRYFHMLVKIRHAKRYSNMLKNNEGHWVHGHSNLATLVTTYFAQFF